MSTQNASADPLDAAPAERRRFPRKRVLLSGVVADANGQNAVDCTIRDVSSRGAQVAGLPKVLERGTELYLVDTRNEAAHLATVAWCNAGRTGLSFVRSYSLDLTLPPPLEFLGKLLIEAKLRQVRALMKRGVPMDEATRVVGVTENYLDRFIELGRNDGKVTLLLHQARRLLSG